jgi:hypothetical protein
MQTITHNHRINCFDEACICERYHEIVISKFEVHKEADIIKEKL